jgi:hypothetical protein
MKKSNMEYSRALVPKYNALYKIIILILVIVLLALVFIYFDFFRKEPLKDEIEVINEVSRW